jgi:hypothetical protein
MTSALVTALTPRRLSRASRSAGVTPLVLLLLVGTAVLASAAAMLGGPTASRFTVGLGAVAIFLVVADSSFGLALGLMVVWLILLGFVRRLLIPFAGWSPQDPLLLVAPVGAIALLLFAPTRAHRREPLTPLVSLLMLWTVAEVANPHQESVAVAVQGLLFWAVPLLWFFVGRHLDEATELQVHRVVLWVAVPVLVLGYYQSFVGLLPFEYTWLGVSNFGPGIFLGGFRPRPFSTLVSPQEYGYFLVFVLCLLWTRALSDRAHRRHWTTGFLVTAFALVLQGSRSVFATFLVMTAVCALAWTRKRLVRIAVATLFVVITIAAAFTNTEVSLGESKPGVLISHQINGILHPSASTFPQHSQLIREAVAIGWREPFGIGIGTTSLAATKGQVAAISAENDIATTVAAFGLIPGIVFVIFIAQSIVVALRRFRRLHTGESLATLGILIAFLTQWWAGGMYGASALLWLTLGALAGQESVERRRQPAHAVPASEEARAKA